MIGGMIRKIVVSLVMIVSCCRIAAAQSKISAVVLPGENALVAGAEGRVAVVLLNSGPDAETVEMPANLPATLISNQSRDEVKLTRADTGPATPDPPGIDLTRCETQRNLNDSGRAQAAEIGREFRRLRIPVGAVRSSQFCRCRETAQIAFGRYEVAAEVLNVLD